MKRALVTLVVACACGGGGDDRTKGDRGDEDVEAELVKKTKRYRDEACDCKDATCADEVKSDFRAWRKKMKAKLKDADKPPARTLDRVEELEKQLETCLEERASACGQLKRRVCEDDAACIKAFDADMKTKDLMSADERDAVCKMVLDDRATTDMMKQSMKRKARRSPPSDPGSNPTPDVDPVTP